MKTILTILISFGAFSAQAQGVFFDGVSQKMSKCYSRAYTAKELATKPNQEVTHMAAKLYRQEFNFMPGAPFGFLKIQAKRKSDNKVYSVELACSEDGMCSIDCDGPRTQLQWSTSRKGSIVVDARNETGNYLSLDPILCGDDMDEDEMEAASFTLNGLKNGDDLFRLDPMPDYQCL